MRSLSAALICSTLLALCTTTRVALADAPLPGELVQRELDALADHRPSAHDPAAIPRLLTLLEHQDALAPDALRAALARLAASPSRLGDQARLALSAIDPSQPTPPPLPALAVAELAPDADLLALHARLVASARATLDAPYDPDDPDRRWVAPAAGPLGLLALDELVDGARVVVHVAVPLSVPPASPGAPTSAVTLHLGASGDLALSIASPDRPGHLAGTATHLTRAAPRQLELPLTLPPGPHLMLFTLRPDPAEPAALRLSLAGPHAPSPPLAPRLQWVPFDPPARPPALPYNADVRALLGGSRVATLQGQLLARLLGLPDLDPSPTRPTPRLEDRLVAASLSPADFVLALGAVPRAEDRASLLLARLDQGRCARCPRDPTLLLALADHTATRGQLVQASELVAEAARADPTPAERAAIAALGARLARLRQHPEEVLVAYGVHAPELDAPAIAARLASASTRTRLEVAQAALDLGRADVTFALVDALAALAPGRLDLQLARVRAALAAGAIDQAASTSRALAAAHPERPTLALAAADRLLARAAPGDPAAARALVESALPRLAWKPDALVDAARLYEALGEPRAAARAYTRALEVSPAHDAARRQLERINGVEPAPFSLTLADALAAPVVDPSASFEVLTEEHIVQVRADGSATHYKRRIFRAQTVPAAREARTLTIPFDPTQHSVRVLDATVRRASAGPVTADTRPEPAPERILQSIAEDWYGLYYDLRQLAIPFDHLERGDIIEVSWRIDPVGQLFPGVLDLFEVLADRVPKHLHRIVVETPPGGALDTRLGVPDGMHLASRTDTTALPDGGTRHVLEVRALPALPAERLAPGTAELSPVWQATTFKSWRELATWYRRLIEPQKVLTPAMRAFVAEVTADKATPGEILGRLADHVTREIRYVGLEFGIHGHKPYRTDQVWARRFGDCKDKATLLSLLLSEAGLDSEVTLVRTRKEGRLPGALPSLALFDHVVLYLPSRDELVDPTATYFGLGELPRDDQGAQILVLSPPDEPADLAISRVDPPARNGVVGTYSVALQARGGAGIQGTVALSGTQAAPYRALLIDPSSRKVRLAELMNRRFPGLNLRDFRVSDPRDKSRPFNLVFHAEIPRFGQLRGEADGTLHVTRPTGIDGHVERFAADESRHLPLVLGPPMSWDVTYRYILPDGHRARSLPPDAELQSPFGAYRVAWSDEGHTVSVRVELAYHVDQVSASEYAGLRDFVRAFDAAVAPPLVLAKTQAPSAPPATVQGEP